MRAAGDHETRLEGPTRAPTRPQYSRVTRRDKGTARRTKQETHRRTTGARRVPPSALPPVVLCSAGVLFYSVPCNPVLSQLPYQPSRFRPNGLGKRHPH